MNEFLRLIEIMIWPSIILVIIGWFRGTLIEFLKPSTDGQSSLKISMSGIEINKIVKSASSATIAAMKSSEKDDLNDHQTREESIIKDIENSFYDINMSKKDYKNFRILWVDDNPYNNNFLIKSFMDLGMEVQIAFDTNMAIEIFKMMNFNIIITDMDRPPEVLAGLNLIEKIREINQEIEIAIFANYWARKNHGKEKLYRVQFISHESSKLFFYVLKCLKA